MKHDSNENSDEIARKVVEEYFRNDELAIDEKNEFISRIRHILRD
jgi:hypothetical protein